jgi:hypothetical protein
MHGAVEGEKIFIFKRYVEIKPLPDSLNTTFAFSMGDLTQNMLPTSRNVDFLVNPAYAHNIALLLA